MAMKKKFLGLALAAAVALPATSAYAAPIIMGENESQNHEVRVDGTVLGKKGEVPSGKISVELPTAMQFTVHEDSTLTAANYTVNNTGSVPVQVSVSSFNKTNGSITVKKKTELQGSESSLDRSNIYLELNGNVGGETKIIDLGNLSEERDKRILTVGAQTDGVITLTGAAGKQAVVESSGGNPDGVDKNGASGEFSLIFRIQKDKK